MVIRKAWLGYTVYCIVLTAVLLYFRFPSGPVTEFLQAKAGVVAPRLALSIGAVHLSPTLGLKFDRAGISFKENPGQALFRTDDLVIKPEIWPLLKGGLTCRFNGSAYSGRLTGRARWSKKAPGADLDLTAELAELHMEGFKYVQTLIGRQLEGRLSGTIAYNGGLGKLTAGSTEANLILKECRLEYMNLYPLGRFEPVEFKEAEASLVLKNRNVSLKRIELKGAQLNCTLTGTVRLEEELLNSRIDLKGSISPSAAFLQGNADMTEAIGSIKRQMKRGSLSLVISGTLREPKVNFL